MDPNRGPVVIAGAGIGGLTLAVALQDRGFEVVVLERDGGIRDQGAGISLWPNALGALDVLGLGDLVRGLGRSLGEGAVRRPDGRRRIHVEADDFVTALGERLVCVDRGVLIRVLADRLRPGTIRTAATVSGYHRTEASVVVRIDEEGDVEGAALIGADGLRSAVAAQLNGGLH